MDNLLHILPTSRAIRAKKREFLNSNSLIPKMATISDFESKAVLLKQKVLIDSLLRVIYLKKASDFKDFAKLKSDFSLVKFYTHSKDFFRFFEELKAEKVDFKDLLLADSYAEFERDLNILKKLLDRYKELINKDGFSDKIFISSEYELNLDYLNSFDGFVLELEGYLTKFELELFLKIAKIKPFFIKIATTPYNYKMVKIFKELGIFLKANSYIEFNLSTKEILNEQPLNFNSSFEVIKTKERLEQIAIAFAKVQEFVDSGIKPCNIAIITPDETIAQTIKTLDKLGNINLAMGKSYKNYNSFKSLVQLKEYLKGSEIAYEFLKRLEVDFSKIKSGKIDVNEFFLLLKELNLPLYKEEDIEKELDKLNLLQSFYKFNRVFSSSFFTFSDWLFLWIENIKEHSIDDIGGGKVTVMGVLESRALKIDGVVVLDFNESFVPATSNKDRFLNSAVRKAANLPTKEDRENLQKHYYKMLFSRAKKVAILYQKDDVNSESKFLYELGLNKNITEYKAPIELFYKSDFNLIKSHLDDKEIEFNAIKFIWSPTMLKTFLECKRKFFYKYIQKLQEPTSDELNEGQILHIILAKILNPNSHYSSKEELKKAFLIEVEKLDEKKELTFNKFLWSDMLDEFFNKQIEHLNSRWQIKSCEFEIKGKIGGLDFKGRVDRLDKKGDFYLVIDYKSGSSKGANLKDIEKITDFQMSIYAKLLDKPVNSIDFAFLEILNSGEFIYLQEQESKEQRLLEHIEELKSLSSFKASRCEDLTKCRYCAYRLLCHRGEYL